jgi:hypothetical protein
VVFVLPGGREDASGLAAAIEGIGDDSNLVDVRAIETLRVGEATVAFLAGAAGPRYARSEDVCAFDDGALEALGETLDDRAGPRLLFSWAAPGEPGVAVGIEREAAGDARLGAWLGARGPTSVIFAWPTVTPCLPTSGGERVALGEARPALRLAVGPAAGPGRSADDGTLVPPRAALIEVRDEGVALVEVSSDLVAPTTP